MAIYNYKGLNKTGKEIKDSVTAEGMAQAKSKLRGMGIMLIDIKEQKSDTAGKGQGLNISFGPSINVSDLALMTRQLATLIKAKIQVVEAFSALIDQTESPKLKIILSEIRQKVNEGTSLAKALSDYPKVFNNVYVNMVEAGEASGTLEIVLLRLADFTESQMKLRNKIRGAILYPAIMMTVGFLMMMIIFIFVIPRITQIFESMRRDLPLQTQICIWISDFLQNYWWAVIGGSFFGWIALRSYVATKRGQWIWHKLLLKLPIAGEIVMMVNVSRFCSTLATLLNSGVPILTAMDIVRNIVANVHMKEAVSQSRNNVQEGASLTGPLVNSGLFPPMVTHMIKLGENSGELEPMLKIVSENYEDQVENKLNGLTSVLEPILLVCMGLAVAFIVFSVIVPIMELNTIS